LTTGSRFVLPAALFVLVVGGLVAWKVPNLGAQAGGDDLVTASPSPTPPPTTSPTPIPSITPTPTAVPTGPACPAATAPPGGTCPPCPGFGAFQANDVGGYSTCAPTLTPTPYPVITPCPTVSPTGCDVITYPIGDANCDYVVDEKDALGVIGDAAGGTPAPCRSLGNVKCDDPLDVLDALFILQYKAGITPQIPAWCPPIGAMIFTNFAVR
jgi:hypothetical protein